jgi:acetyl esterase/lipase
MAFDDLPPQTLIYPAGAEDYGRRALELSRAAAATVPHALDIAYGEDYWQRVDIYMPPRSAGALPVLLFAHGGAWTHGYKEWIGLMAPTVTAFPAILVSVSYRLAPDHRYPVPVEDCLSALAWCRDNIARYGGDPGRISVGGHSAGGHLYALLTLRRDMLKRAGLPADAIKACFPVSAQLDLVFENPAPGSGEERIYTMFLARREDAVSASPLHQIAGTTTPFVLAAGEHDFPRIIRANEVMHAALRRQGTPVEHHFFPGFDHFDMALDLARAENPIVRAMKRHMLGETAAAARALTEAD